MRRTWHLLLWLLAFSVSEAQDFSNKGKEFWVGYGNHQVMYTNNQQGFNLYFTSDVNTKALVEIPGLGYSTTVDVVANEITTVNIPQSATLTAEGKVAKGIHVVAERPIVVYGHIFYQAVSGATLCLPVNTLGREYYSINYTQVAQNNLTDAYSFFFVVATEDNTTVEITPAATTIGGRTGGLPFTETLNKGEVYQVLSQNDLTGSLIRSINTGQGCKRIAVFSGSGRIGIGCSGPVTSSDNLFQQVYPTSTWGKKYITVTSKDRARNFYRVIRPDPSGQVKVNGTPVANSSFINGFYYEFSSSTPSVIEADKPIMVAQYFTTQACGEGTNNGDPEMIYLNPIEQTIKDVTLTSMALINPNSNKHYLNIIVRNTPAATSSMKLDGIPVTGFQPIPLDTAYAFVQMETTLGTHRITCDSGFNAIAYGFANVESYGYSAGTNLRDLYQFVQVRNQYATANFPAGCRNTPFRFSMVFPYKPLRIEWDFGGLFPNATVVSPVHDSSWVVNDKTLYRYTIARPYSIAEPGSYPIRIIAENPSTDGCSGLQEIDYDLQIFDAPKADFQFTTNGCATDSVSFLDISGPLNARPIASWIWDMGDGTGKPDRRSFRYRFPGGNNYNVKMQVITDIGCLSAPMEKTIALENIPVPSFNSTLACKDATVQFTENGNLNGGTISKWRWNFGDGKVDSSTTAGTISHVYTRTGTFKATLSVVNSKGCVSNTVTRDIAVNSLPVGGFGMPEVCLNDAFAEFTDSSSSSDNTALSYRWDFGDGGTSTERSPRHKYNAARVYNVQQIVISSTGCRDTLTRAFTVNGATPAASLQLKTTGVICSNRLVEVVNNSTVDFGRVTKLEIFWDPADASRRTVDEDPLPGKTYQYIYPPFGSPASRKVRIRLVAYSGSICRNESFQEIDLLAAPSLVFGAVPTVCENIKAFQFSQASETSGLAGTARFTGRGVDDKGLFDPAVAGRGSHLISYIYTSAGGCSDTASTTVRVSEVPRVDAGPDRAVLPGGKVTLNASASGPSLSILWSPPTDMDDPRKLRPVVSPSADITYTLTARTAEGCETSDDVLVKYLTDLKIPNTFTPNGDGYNDRWEILSLDSYPGSLLEVYNTAGQLVYRTQGYSKPWDGTNNGKPMPAGTYYYVIDPKNGKKKIAGYVTLIR